MTRPAYRDHITSLITIATDRGGGRRSATKTYFFKVLGYLTPTVEVRSPTGIRYFVDTQDTGVGLHVYKHGAFDAQAMDDILLILKREAGRTIAGKTIIDVGANIGTTTLLALKHYGASRVVAFEPEPRNLDLLRLALTANDLTDAAEIYPVALSDIDTTLTMELSPVNAGDHRIRKSVDPGDMGEDAREVVTIQAVRFDSLDIDLTDVALVWIDIQGHEAQMLAGATTLLATNVPIFAEYCPYLLRRSEGLDLFHELVEHNFDRVIDCHTGEAVASRDLSKLAARYPMPTEFTDLLLLHA